MKKLSAILALTAALGAGSAANAEAVGTISDWDHEKYIRVNGTVDHKDLGQIYLRTANGDIIQLPGMVMMWNVDPTLSFETLQANNTLDLRIPRRSLRVIKSDGDKVFLGNYEGVFVLPQNVYSAWLENGGFTATDDDEFFW